MRYTIAPAAKLSPHIHPGVQLARIESGTLTYTIVSGTAMVTRAGGAAEPVVGPTTISLAAGDSVAENLDMVHFGENQTDRTGRDHRVAPHRGRQGPRRHRHHRRGLTATAIGRARRLGVSAPSGPSWPTLAVGGGGSHPSRGTGARTRFMQRF